MHDSADTGGRQCECHAVDRLTNPSMQQHSRTAMARTNRTVAEFGDFQTPEALCRQVLDVVARLRCVPASVIEPSCGTGGFLAAAGERFPAAVLVGLDINRDHLDAAEQRLVRRANPPTFIHGDFFTEHWEERLASLAGPILVVGNPPWVTNAALGVIGSRNLPAKGNFHQRRGLDALTGKSNFDISEAMLLRNLAWLREKTGILAVLCKFAVARKILAFAWQRGIPLAEARVYRIDALAHFGAAVEACLLVVHVTGRSGHATCPYYPRLDSAAPSKRFGLVDDILVADLSAYQRYRMLRSDDRCFTWRSGLKHDCARVMELARMPGGWRNGLGEVVQLEDTYLLPLIKSADISGRQRRRHEKYVIVSQRRVGEDTRLIRDRAPLTWDYLDRHRAAFRRRASRIYRNQPDFAVFGIGAYSFAPWKIAISGLYKQLTFRLFGPRDGKPVLFDDTVYFLPFDDEDAARRVLGLVNSAPAQALLKSMVFWDDKRPITAELLKRVDLAKVAKHSSRQDRIRHCPLPGAA
jgi:hypothetical protein